MSRRSFLHVACAVLLLIAQHGALTHAVWHLGNHSPAQTHQALDGDAHAPDRDDSSPQSRLCDLHFSLGQILSGDCAGWAVLSTLPLSHWLATAPSSWRIAQPVVTPPSRAPPVLL